MAEKRIGIIMHGVTGRMGTNQHLVRSILAIRSQGGVALKNGMRLMPDPILVGRNAAKLQALAQEHDVARWTTDLDGALGDKSDAVFFDAASTELRPQILKQAIAAGKRPASMDADETIIYNFATELLNTKQVSDPMFKVVKDRFGERGVVDLIGVMGYYQLVSMLLNVDRHPLPAGVKQELQPLK